MNRKRKFSTDALGLEARVKQDQFMVVRWFHLLDGKNKDARNRYGKPAKSGTVEVISLLKNKILELY